MLRPEAVMPSSAVKCTIVVKREVEREHGRRGVKELSYHVYNRRREMVNAFLAIAEKLHRAVTPCSLSITENPISRTICADVAGINAL